MISKYRTETQAVEIPTEFECDVCGRTVTLSDEYDRKYKTQPSDHMAVVKYSYPAGGWGERTATEEVHCCSIKCLSKFIPKIPYDATVTIPMNDKFKTDYGGAQ